MAPKVWPQNLTGKTDSKAWPLTQKFNVACHLLEAIIIIKIKKKLKCKFEFCFWILLLDSAFVKLYCLSHPSKNLIQFWMIIVLIMWIFWWYLKRYYSMIFIRCYYLVSTFCYCILDLLHVIFIRSSGFGLRYQLVPIMCLK